jgi:co-chaperonin GroES (HSP10)
LTLRRLNDPRDLASRPCRTDIPEDTDAVKTKRALEKSGFAVPKSVEEDLDKKALRENASMDKGVVIAIGETAFRDYGIDCPVKVGDYISYAKFGGKDITDPETDKVYVAINDEDIIAILSKKEPLDG